MNSKNKNRRFDPIPRELEIIEAKVVDSAYKVHKTLGPGLLEKVYEACFCHELAKRELTYKRQEYLPVNYDGLVFDEGYRIDVLAHEEVICELKAADEFNPIWEAQLLTYMRLAGKRLGYLINFNTTNISQGIRRYVL